MIRLILTSYSRIVKATQMNLFDDIDYVHRISKRILSRIKEEKNNIVKLKMIYINENNNRKDN